MDFITPVQFKMTSGAVYVGFPGEVDEFGMFEFMAGCSMAFVRSEARYEVSALMIATEPVELNMMCVQMCQEVIDNSETSLAYCKYLASLVATMKRDKVHYYEEFEGYIRHMDDYYKSQTGGIGILLDGEYDYAVMTEDPQAANLLKKVQKAQEDYKKRDLTVPEEKACQSNVVELHFGSKRNASEEKDD